MSQDTSGLSNRQKAALITAAFVLSSTGVFTALEGVIKDNQIDEALGIAAIVGGVAAAAIKEFLTALGVPIPSQAFDSAVESYLARKGITFPPK